MINELWFLVLVLMLGAYAVLDGFDLGVGTLHFVLPRNERERGAAINAIGPVWNGNEVWLLAAGGAMVVAFPVVYAESFSGFYLALMIVLWLFVFRGLGIEFRHQIDHPVWRHAWDIGFSAASALLALLFGVALGNVLRGVPLDADGRFQGTFALLLNPFAVVGGLLSVATLSMHGAAYLAMKSEGDLHRRARRSIVPLWWAVAATTALMVAGSFVVRPDFTRNFLRWPLLLIVPAAGLASFSSIRGFVRRGQDARAFVASAATIVALLGSAAAGLFPRLLPTFYGSATAGLDIYNAASPASSLRIALGIYAVGMAIVLAYLVNVYRVWGGRVGAHHTYKI